MKSFIAALLLSFAVTSGVAAEFSDAELVELGQSYAEAINQLDANALNALISAKHLAQDAAEIAGDGVAEKLALSRAFTREVPTMMVRMLEELERQHTRAIFMRVHELDGMRGPLVRYNVGDGYNYALLLPVRPDRTSRRALIGDLYFATNGERLSESLGIAVKLLTSPSETFLGKLFGGTNVNAELVARFRKAGQLRQQGRLYDAFDTLDDMPGNTRNHYLVLTNTLQIAAQLDDDLYRQELQRLAKHHKDNPKAVFTLLDHYFYQNDFDAAMSTINLMEQSYGTDAVMFIFRANLEYERGRIGAALDFARKAVELEPDNEDPQWLRLTLSAESGAFDESVQVLQVLQSEFSYEFAREDFTVDSSYEDLVKSEEFARWIE